jgi:PIN domain nuclease of toxin-antitoxin system
VIVLDTHALIWWVAEPAKLPVRARRLLEGTTRKAGSGVAVSSISTWEIAMLVERGRLELRLPVDEWIARVEALPFLQFVPVDNRIAARAARLEEFPHRDPADRMILATAIGLGATLVTGDPSLRGYHKVHSVWS